MIGVVFAFAILMAIVALGTVIFPIFKAIFWGAVWLLANIVDIIFGFFE